MCAVRASFSEMRLLLMIQSFSESVNQSVLFGQVGVFGNECDHHSLLVLG